MFNHQLYDFILHRQLSLFPKQWTARSTQCSLAALNRNPGSGCPSGSLIGIWKTSKQIEAYCHLELARWLSGPKHLPLRGNQLQASCPLDTNAHTQTNRCNKEMKQSQTKHCSFENIQKANHFQQTSSLVYPMV